MIRSKHRRTSRQRTRTQARAATSAQILAGSPASIGRIPSKWKEQHKRLLSLRNDLLNQRQDLNRDAREENITFSEHMADAGTDSYDRDFALSMLSAEGDALYEIDQAIKRIETGAYGICEVTGKKIEAARLQAIPWTRFSAEAARELERSGELRKAQLAELGTVTGTGGPKEAANEDDEGGPPE